MKEPELKKNEVQITSKHRIAFDPKNLTLLTRYQKRDGRGKDKEFIDEYDYNKSGYYGNIEVLGSRLVDREFMEGLNPEDKEEVESLKQVIDSSLAELKELKQEIITLLKDGITVNLGKEDE